MGMRAVHITPLDLKHPCTRPRWGHPRLPQASSAGATTPLETSKDWPVPWPQIFNRLADGAVTVRGQKRELPVCFCRHVDDLIAGHNRSPTLEDVIGAAYAVSIVTPSEDRGQAHDQIGR